MIWELLIGAGCALAGGLVGHFQGYLMGVKVRNATQLFAPPPPPEPKQIQSETHCQCGHGLQTHRAAGKGTCVVAVQDSTCACQFFVGKQMPNPKYKEPGKAGYLDLP